jgi:hypothetical protein
MGGGKWNGWIPDCDCERCQRGIAEAKARMPVRLRVVGAEDGSGTLPEPPAATGGGWAQEPLSLLTLAVALEHLVGPSPDAYADGLTPELSAWFDRHCRAADILAEVANGDAAALRSIVGPPHDDDGPRPPGTGLVVTAAIILEPKAGER